MNIGIDIDDTISETFEKLKPVLHFGGINLSESPVTIIKNADGKISLIAIAIAIPILAGVFQFLQTKLAPSQTVEPNGEDNTMMASMKTMNTVMPLMSVFFCFSFFSAPSSVRYFFGYCKPARKFYPYFPVVRNGNAFNRFGKQFGIKFR